jgi:hypothetical protein
MLFSSSGIASGSYAPPTQNIKSNDEVIKELTDENTRLMKENAKLRRENFELKGKRQKVYI